MKFPYGISDFREIMTKGYFYCDRTDRIPRRFGKSLLLSMLANYYDVARKDQFQELFGELGIGRNPTPLHSQYFILQWDFSCIEIRRGYTDLTMIVRPDMRRFDIFDVLIEFKYVGLKKAGMTGEKARNLADDALRKIPDVKAEMENAEDQVRKYGDALELKYDNMRLRRYAVVSLGFERLWWKEIC